MFLHFHKVTTELFHSIKTQQISLFNASVGSLLIVCATFSEQLKALVCKAQHCQTEDCVLQVSGSFDLDSLRRHKKMLYLLCCCLKFVKLCVQKGYLLTSVAVTVMLCHMSVSRSSGLASVIFPSSTLMLNCLSRSVWRSMKYLQM